MLRFNDLRQNCVGGITAAIVALPLALAFGVASGAGAAAGLYGAIATGFFASLFGGTAAQITGPTGPMTVVMTVVLLTFVEKYGAEQGMLIGYTVVVFAGIFQYIFGYAKWGNYINLIPYPVISAFMSGIGFLIIILQIPTLYGIKNAGVQAADIIMNFSNYAHYIDFAHLSLGMIVFGITYMVPRKINRFIPATLIALIVGTTLSMTVFNTHSMEVIGEIPRGLPNFHWPLFIRDEAYLILKYALVLAALGSIDSLLTSVIVDNITKTHHDSNQELKGQGIGNIVSGLIGGLPGAGATMRTLINVRSGGTTRLSGVMHAITLSLLLLGLGHIVKPIPHVALSGVLLRVGIDIIDWPFLKQIYKLSTVKAFIILTIIFLTIFSDLLNAVGFGVFAFSLLALKKLADAQIKTMVDHNHDIIKQIKFSRLEKQIFDKIKDKIKYIYLSGPLSFGAVREMRKLISEPTSIRIIDLIDVNVVDLSSVMILAELAKDNNCTTLFVIAEEKLKEKSLQAMGFSKKSKFVYTNRIAALQEANTKCCNTFSSTLL